MNKISFLAYVPDPFGVRAVHYYLCNEHDQPTAIASNKVSEYDGLIVTFECAALVDELQRVGLPPPSNLADLSDALRLCVGIPRDEGGERRWDVWSWLSPYFPNLEDAKLFKAIFESRHERPDELLMTTLMVSAAIAIRCLWEKTVKCLAASGELERFTAVEIPIQGIFSYRQYAGIRINNEIAATVCLKIRDEKYHAYREVASALGRSPTGLNFWNIQQHLASTDVNHLSDIDDGGRLRDAFKLAAFRSTFARNFLAYIESSRDEVIVRQAIGQHDRLHPVFRVMGTVTGRILVSDPYLQQLRRSHRGIISADPGLQLKYLDYSQFEPGIVAFLSKDEQLIRAYNDGDVYTALSERVFGSAQYRSLSKRIYLAFCYGMSAEGIAKLVARSESSNSELVAYRDAISEFFSAFSGLTNLHSFSESELIINGYVGSLFGNKRYRRNDGPLTAKERRWALNQRVQATASLIFKEALAALEKQFGRQRIVLPVHDAVLMQFEADSTLETNVENAVTAMKNAFMARCPGIRVRVTVGEFSES